MERLSMSSHTAVKFRKKIITRYWDILCIGLKESIVNAVNTRVCLL